MSLRQFANALDDLGRLGPEAFTLLRHTDAVDAAYSEMLADRARWDVEDRAAEIGDVM